MAGNAARQYDQSVWIVAIKRDATQVMTAETTASVRTWTRETRKPVTILMLTPTTTMGKKRIDVPKAEIESTRWKLWS